MPLTEITEEETGKVYVVRSNCLACEGTWAARESEHAFLFNTKSGVLHIQGNQEFTACGRDATGENWLWQL